MSGTTTSHAHTYPPMPAPVTFPPQPPHSNVLSSEERARLLRSNKKLARLLGSTPHFVDQEQVESPWSATDDTTSSLAPSSRPSTASAPPKSLSLARIVSRPSRPSTAQGTYASESPSREDAWRARKATLKSSADASKSIPASAKVPPRLKLAYSATEGLPLTAVAADAPRPALPSPSSYAIPSVSSRRRMGDKYAEETEIDLPLRSAPIRRSSSRSTARREPAAKDACSPSPTSTTFSDLEPVQTEASVRRTKLDKLRRTLGEELPARAVFPAAPAASSKGHKPSKSMSHTHSHGQFKPRPAHAPSASTSASEHRASSKGVSVIALPGANGERTHTVMLKTSTSTSASSSRSHSRPHDNQKHTHTTAPHDLLSLANLHLGTGIETGDSAGLLGTRRKPSASATLGGEQFLKARRAKAHGRPEIEFVGFMGRTGV